MAQEDVVDSGYSALVFNEAHEERRPWQFCDHTLSRSLAVFISQVTVALFLILFSCVKIHLKKEGEDASLWVAALGVAVGYFFPNPKL